MVMKKSYKFVLIYNPTNERIQAEVGSNYNHDLGLQDSYNISTHLLQSDGFRMVSGQHNRKY